MALPLPSPFSVSEDAAQRAMERQILTLLHRATKPDALATMPLMRAICRATATPNALDALDRVVRDALDGRDPSAVMRREIIFASDFNRLVTNAQLAARNGISRRHFQRRRAQAITAIARFARNLLARNSELAEVSDRPVAERRDSCVRRDDAAWRFKLEMAAYVRARDRGRAPEMRCIAGSLVRLATTGPARAWAQKYLADANARLGHVDEAMAQLHGLPPNARALIRAELALLERDAQTAEDCARSALSESDGADRYRCFALISQARLMRAAPWRPPPEALDPAVHSWERVAIDVENARHLVLEGQWSDAERHSRCAWNRAEEFGFYELAARCAAILATTCEVRGSKLKASWWRARAIERLLPTQDRLLATGLFPRNPCSPEGLADRLLSGVLYDRLCLIVPQMFGEDREQRAVIVELLATILNRCPTSGSRSPALERAIAAVARSESAFADYAETCLRPISEMLALAQTALTGAVWAGVFDSLFDVFSTTARELRPAAPRAVPVTVPHPAKSQQSCIDHLKMDEKCAGDGIPIEALADLRVRFLSFRSRTRASLTRHRRGSFARTAHTTVDPVDSR
ncbi:MAG: hypothetical protein WBE79_08840 [Candidatus Cybelea sp.]